MLRAVPVVHSVLCCSEKLMEVFYAGNLYIRIEPLCAKIVEHDVEEDC